MNDSGEPTPVRARYLGDMKLANLIGVGAGRIAGLLLVHGKAVSQQHLLLPKKLKVSSLARSTRITTHQHLKLRPQLIRLKANAKGSIRVRRLSYPATTGKPVVPEEKQ